MDHPDVQELFSYALGEVKGPRREQVSDHLAVCESCSQLQSELTSGKVPASTRPSRFTPAERLRDDDSQGYSSRAIGVVILVTLVGVLVSLFAGGLLLRGEDPFSDKNRRRAAETSRKEGRVLESQGQYRGALMKYRDASSTLRVWLEETDEGLEKKIGDLELRLLRLETGKREYGEFVLRLAESNAKDLASLLREGRRLQAEYSSDTPEWMPELGNILKRMDRAKRPQHR